MIRFKKIEIAPLLWIMLFDHTCLNITFPILTLLFFDAQSSLFSPDVPESTRKMAYGLCVAVPHIVNLFVTPVLSTLSDSLGRKKILLVATFGAALFAITAAFGTVLGWLWLFFIGRIIQGAFSRTNPIAQAIVGDVSSKDNKVLYMGYLQTAISIGAFIGPILGGYLAQSFYFKGPNYSFPYFLAAVLGMISFLLTAIFFKETRMAKKELHRSNLFNWPSAQKLLFDPNILKISLVLFLIQLSWSFYYQFVPPVLKSIFHFDARQLGVFIGLIALWLALATGFGIRILQRHFSLHQILLFSIYLVLIGTLMSFLLCCFRLEGTWTFLIWAAAVPTAVGDVIAFSCLTALYSDAVSKPDQGKAMGICFIVVAFTWGLTGLLGGALMSIYTLLPMMIAPIGIVLALALLKMDRFVYCFF